MEMEIKKGGGGCTAGQKSSNAAAVEWQWKRRDYESYPDPSLPTLPPSPQRHNQVTSILTHSFADESRACFCYTDEIVPLQPSWLLLERAGILDCLSSIHKNPPAPEYVQRKAHAHTHTPSIPYLAVLYNWMSWGRVCVTAWCLIPAEATGGVCAPFLLYYYLVENSCECDPSLLYQTWWRFTSMW